MNEYIGGLRMTDGQRANMRLNNLEQERDSLKAQLMDLREAVSDFMPEFANFRYPNYFHEKERRILKLLAEGKVDE